jgi:hypothetical protein
VKSHVSGLERLWMVSIRLANAAQVRTKRRIPGRARIIGCGIAYFRSRDEDRIAFGVDDLTIKEMLAAAMMGVSSQRTSLDQLPESQTSCL